MIPSSIETTVALAAAGACRGVGASVWAVSTAAPGGTGAAVSGTVTGGVSSGQGRETAAVGEEADADETYPEERERGRFGNDFTSEIFTSRQTGRYSRL